MYIMKITIIFIIFLFLFTFLFTEGFAQDVNLPNDFGTMVYEFAGEYYVKNSHDIITSNIDPDIVIKTALARGGDIYVAGGTYYLSESFSGFDLKYGTHLKMASDAKIIVPSGYAGYVFRFSNWAGQCIIDGGQIHEANPVKRNWIGIMMQGGIGGVFFNYIENMVITDPYVVIDFNATTGQWINANTFVNIKGWNFVRGIEFDFLGNHINGIDGFDGNTFRDSQFQSGPMTTYGVKDIKHSFNAFYNVQFWDLPAKAMSTTIDSSAENTIIIGGQMTYQGFVDHGVGTIVLDAWHHNALLNSMATLAIINDTYQSKVNTPTILSHQVLNMIIPKQSTNGFVNGNNAQLVVSQGNPTEIIAYGTISDPKGGSVILHITRPDGVVEQNEAYVASGGTFYYPMFFDRNSQIGQYIIYAQYQNSNLGSLLLNVTTDLPPSDQTYAHTNMTALTDESYVIIPTWIKNDAKMWSQDQLSDNDFGDSIQYLVRDGIIKKTNGTQTLLYQSMHIPTWFKNNAKWWADGQISDREFILGVQYLFNMRQY